MKSSDYERYLSESEGIERDWHEDLRKSNRTAWRVTAVALALAVLGFAAGYAGMSQEPAPPAVVRVDKATGAVEYVGVMRDVEQSYGEQSDKYWINNFMLCRESYDWHTIQECYNKMGLMASPTVQADYSKLYNDTDGRQVTLATNARIIPHVISITPNLETSTATVRFTTQKVESSGLKGPEERWVATLAYRYVTTAALSESERRINLLGFQVTSYRTDREF